MKPRVWIQSITFNDQTKIDLDKNDVIVFVGPNNSGKSAALRGLDLGVGSIARCGPVIQNIALGYDGTSDNVLEWLQKIGIQSPQDLANKEVRTPYGAFHLNNVGNMWSNIRSGISGLSRVFCKLLAAEQRLLISKPAPSIALSRETATNPIHHLYRDDELREQVSESFKKAFGIDLLVHYGAGNEIPLHTGIEPPRTLETDRVSQSYISNLEKLPRLETQGDGMRSFAGVLLEMVTGHCSILLIDEPEAFLHPPQARLLGQLLVSKRQQDHQLFISTHSGDLLRGLLDSNASNVRIIRLSRDNTNINHIHQLKNDEVNVVWKDPLLRYSNILDGVFHEHVVACESDSDCRFYAAVTDALTDSSNANTRKPDVLFTHCGTKSRLAMIVKSLKHLGVPVSVITDFDILQTHDILKQIVDAAGGCWEDLVSDWKTVSQSISAKNPDRSADTIKSEIEAILNRTPSKSSSFPEDAVKNIKETLKNSSPWSTAKTTGKSYVPSGTPTSAYNKLIANLENLSIFVVPVCSAPLKSSHLLRLLSAELFRAQIAE